MFLKQEVAADAYKNRYGRTTINMEKYRWSTKICVKNGGKGGKGARQITFELSRKERRNLIEALLEHYIEDDA